MSREHHALLCYGFPIPGEIEMGIGVGYEPGENVDVWTHDFGSESAIRIVGIIESFQESVGYSGPTLIQNLEVKPEWKDMLRSFSKEQHIRFRKPQWILFNSWTGDVR